MTSKYKTGAVERMSHGMWLKHSVIDLSTAPVAGDCHGEQFGQLDCVGAPALAVGSKKFWCPGSLCLPAAIRVRSINGRFAIWQVSDGRFVR